MIRIQEYLEQIFEDFKEENDRGMLLCNLKNLSFESGSLPDYQDSQIQRLYLLRYAFAYAYEYTDMYLDVLDTMGHPSELSVVSIGCGPMLDYWSLVQALRQKNLDFCRIDYTGVDLVDWQYPVESRERDRVLFRKGHGIDFFRDQDCFTQDIYFFPKSISELAEEEIRSIAGEMAVAEFSKDIIYLCVSIRAYEQSRERDIRRTKMLKEALEDNGFTTKGSYDCYTYYKENKGIILYNNDYVYPDSAMDYVSHLNEKCKTFLQEGRNCEEECQHLNRKPIMKTGMILYQVIRFERNR